MKNLHTIIFNLMVYMALVPAAMQANSLTRVLAQNVTKQAAKQMLKNPGVIAAGLGAASWGFAKYNKNKADAMYRAGYWNRPEYLLHRDRARKAHAVKTLLLWFSANYLALQQLRKFGYLPKPSTKEKIMLALIPVGMLKALSRVGHRPLIKLIALEYIVGPLTYLACFA